MLNVAVVAILLGCHQPDPPGSYLYVWAGDSAGKASDFLAVVDANPASSTYGAVITSLATGTMGGMPHHTEAEMPSDNHLLANAFAAGKTWLFDLTNPRTPAILTTFGDAAGFSHPHTFVRLADDTLLATFQYHADSTTAPPTMPMAGHDGMTMPDDRTTGGLVEMDERGTVMRSSSAVDTTVADRKIYPYSVVAIPTIDRAVSTATDMNPADSAPGNWVQFWRLSDLKLLKTVALPAGPLGTEQKWTGEPRLLPDGRNVYIHTFGCGLYLVHGVDSTTPSAQLVYTFPGESCGVPVLTAHYWIQPVPKLHGLVALDIADPLHPRQVSAITVGANDEEPHWLAIDPTGTRLVVNSAGAGTGDRLYVIGFDPESGTLTLDQRFHDPGSTKPGVAMRGKTWPHGFKGTAIPHGTVFSQ
jgi:hypothetical protein